MTQQLEDTSNQVQIFKTRFELAQKALNEVGINGWSEKIIDFIREYENQ